jgi:hypothetical protein
MAYLWSLDDITEKGYQIIIQLISYSFCRANQNIWDSKLDCFLFISDVHTLVDRVTIAGKFSRYTYFAK